MANEELSGKVFEIVANALEVEGDSMVNAGILDGDTVVIRRTDVANIGDIVVALVDDEEATLKRFRRKGASIALEAANPAYETRIFGPDRVRYKAGSSVSSEITDWTAYRVRDCAPIGKICDAIANAFWLHPARV